MLSAENNTILVELLDKSGLETAEKVGLIVALNYCGSMEKGEAQRRLRLQEPGAEPFIFLTLKERLDIIKIFMARVLTLPASDAHEKANKALCELASMVATITAQGLLTISQNLNDQVAFKTYIDSIPSVFPLFLNKDDAENFWRELNAIRTKGTTAQQTANAIANIRLFAQFALTNPNCFNIRDEAQKMIEQLDRAASAADAKSGAPAAIAAAADNKAAAAPARPLPSAAAVGRSIENVTAPVGTNAAPAPAAAARAPAAPPITIGVALPEPKPF